MKAKLSDAPECLNTNDKAMWVLGYNEAIAKLMEVSNQLSGNSGQVPAIYIQPNHLGIAKRQVFLCKAAPYQIHDDFVPLFERTAPIPEAGPDANVEAVREKFLQRSIVGLEKYGVTTERTDLSELDWLRHAQEEAMDFCIYLERIINGRT